MSLDINPTSIMEVLLTGGGWMTAREVQLTTVSSPAKWSAAIAFQTGDLSWVYAPLTSVAGIRTTRREESAADTLARKEAQHAAEARLFEHLHYATREVYRSAVERQGARCPGPRCQGAMLSAYPTTHYVEATGQVLCELDSPLKKRVGIPV